MFRREKTKCLTLHAARLSLAALLRSILISFSYPHKWVTFFPWLLEIFRSEDTTRQKSPAILELIFQSVNIICTLFRKYTVDADLSKFRELDKA